MGAMRVVNVAERGATVYISDMHLKIGAGSEIDVSLARADSKDLLTAIEEGTVSVSFTAEEELDTRAANLRGQAEVAFYKQFGTVLSKQLEADLVLVTRNRLVKASNPYVKPAKLVSVA